MNIRSIFFVLLISISSGLYAAIHRIESLNEVSKHVATQQETIVAFDLDNTLVHPAGKTIGSDQWVDYACTKMPFAQLEPLYFAIQHRTSLQLTECYAANIIKQLKGKSIRVVGLTSRSTPLADRTHEQLKALGIHFDENPLYDNDIHFDDAGRVKYVRGIIFCSGRSKGDALRAFLQHTFMRPQNIVFVDDKDKYLRDVEEKLKDLSITVAGLHYTYMKRHIEGFDAQVSYSELVKFLEEHHMPNKEQYLNQLALS